MGLNKILYKNKKTGLNLSIKSSSMFLAFVKFPPIREPYFDNKICIFYHKKNQYPTILEINELNSKINVNAHKIDC